MIHTYCRSSLLKHPLTFRFFVQTYSDQSFKRLDCYQTSIYLSSYSLLGSLLMTLFSQTQTLTWIWKSQYCTFFSQMNLSQYCILHESEADSIKEYKLFLQMCLEQSRNLDSLHLESYHICSDLFYPYYYCFCYSKDSPCSNYHLLNSSQASLR